MKEVKIKGTTVQVMAGDVTDMEVESFVFYAAEDLKLGTGYGNAISMRAGPTVQKALDEIGGAQLTEVVVTEAGEMKAKHIIHAVGPKFLEEDTPAKLKKTIANCFKVAEEKGFKEVAMPPLGCGFYGLPLDQCADLMLEAVKEYCQGEAKVEKVIVVGRDHREYKPFEARIGNLG